MKLNNTNNEIGDEVQPLEFYPGEGDKDVHPEHWKEAGLHRVNKVRMTADSNGQKESVISNTKIERKTLSDGTKVERTLPSEEKEFDAENCFVTIKDAIEIAKKRNVFMSYVVKIKGCDNIIYTREFNKVVMLLETFWSGKDDISQKIVIERTQRTHEEWINLDITPIDIVVQYAHGEIKEITENLRTRDMEKFIFEDDELVAETDEALDMFRDIEEYTQDAAEKAKDMMLDQSEKDDILKDLSLMTEKKDDDAILVSSPSEQKKNVNLKENTSIRNRITLVSSGASKPKPIKRSGR